MVVLVAWLASRPPRRETWVAGLALVVASCALMVGWWEGRKQPLSEEEWLVAATPAYRQLWSGLDQHLQTARRLLPVLPESPEEIEDSLRQDLFSQLAKAVSSTSSSEATLVLVNGDGEVVAWAGEGLLHELDLYALPDKGRTYRASFGSATLLIVDPLAPGRRAWRLIVGQSLAADALPFPSPGPRPESGFRWSLVDRLDQANPGSWVLQEPSTPWLVVEPLSGGTLEPVASRGLGSRFLALGAAALALLGLAVLRGVGLALQPGTMREERTLRQLRVAILGLGGMAAGALAAGVPLLVTGVLLLGLWLAILGLRGRQGPPLLMPVWLKTASTISLLCGSAWLIQKRHGSAIDLSEEIVTSPEKFCLRLAFWAAALGLFLLAARGEEESEQSRDRWAWGALGWVALAAMFHDRAWFSLLLLAAGWWTALQWFTARRSMGQSGRLAAVLVLAALGSATAWEVAYRIQLRSELRSETLVRMAPPQPAELESLQLQVQNYFSLIDPTDLAARAAAGLDYKDLAFLLWKSSPLARLNAVSALVVEPGDDLPAGFAYGMSLTPELEDATLPSDLAGLPLWDDLSIRGGAALRTHTGGWWQLRYWLMPRPGFGLGEQPVSTEIAANLLAERGLALQSIVGLPSSVAYGLYTGDSGRTLLSPWDEAPPLPIDLLQGDRHRGAVQTGVGAAWAYAREGSDGWEVLFLPQLNFGSALDRVGTHSAGILLVAFIAGLIFLLLALPRPAFRGLLRQWWRSYAKRLLLVYTLFLLIPLFLLNIALIAGVKERLWAQQREAGERALVSAQRYLVDYLRQLPPGFGIDTAFGERLRWLSDIVGREINFYWGSRESQIVSSRPELFAAGLLPKRIPGEVFSRLTLGGFNLATRTRSVGEARYVELYAPLRLPGERPGGGRFFLSIPLLAEQEEVAQQLSDLRRQALLLTALLFGLLVTVSARLARGFAAPIMELVEGTRRIAAGAESLDLSLSDLELAAVADAVDDMARRIASGREKVLREKQVVERIVQHITSGVISLDLHRQVLMHNRVAQELIGVEVGQSLDQALGAQERLEPVMEFVSTARAETAQTTVKLPDDAGGEQEWRLVWVPVAGAGEPATLLVMEDATEVLRGQRLAAWAEMARIIAHEIKNPLTPIRLSAEHMKQVYSTDPEHFDGVFARCSTNILRQVDELQQIASEFSTYSSILRIDPKEGDLVHALGELVESYAAAPPPGVEIRFRTEVPTLPARFDRRLLGRAIRNLIENAVRAVGTRGGLVEVAMELTEDQVRISISDEGPGVETAHLGRIFDPYFSTHDTGTGLGLPIARRVAEEHGGSIAATNRIPRGLSVVISLPLEWEPPSSPGMDRGFLS